MDPFATPKSSSTAHVVWRSCVKAVAGIVGGAHPSVASRTDHVTTGIDGETVGSILRARLSADEFAALSVRDGTRVDDRR